MIVSFRHKGLKLFYEKGDASKLQPQHVSKIRDQAELLGGRK